MIFGLAMPPPDAQSDLQLDQFLCLAVYSTNLAFNRVYRPLLEKLGLTYVQYIVLVTLWQADDQFVGVLGSQLFLASNTLTPVLKRLEALGFVTRSRDTVDERQVRVRLTEAGRALRAEAVDIPACIQTASGLTVSDLVRVLDSVSQLRDRLLGQMGSDPLPTEDDLPANEGAMPSKPTRSTRLHARQR